MKWLKTIYKFTPLRTEFLENRFLRITPRVDLNDPYDYYPFESDIEESRKLYESIGIKSNIPKEEISKSHLNGIGIISFTESIDNILMWSHYADSHKGMAIGFNPLHIFFKGLQRVRYTTQRPDLRKEFPKIVGVELFFKSEQWIYEKEWRIVESFNKASCVLNAKTKEISNKIPIPSCFPNLAMLIVPQDAIESITFGVNSDINKIEEIRALINSDEKLSHIKLQKIEMGMDKYELNIIEI